MAFSKSFKTDLDLENNGVWLGIGTDVDTGVTQEICVKFFGNDKAQRLLKNLREPYKKQFRNGKVPSNIEDDIYIKVVAKEVLVDWRGFLDDKQKEIPFTEEYALELLRDPEYKQFRADVVEACSTLESFRKIEVEEGSKNLEKSSTGKQNGDK